MNPFATSRRSFCGTPNSLTWSPGRTASRVQGLSFVTSTRTVSPGFVWTTNSRGVTDTTLPCTCQRSSPTAGPGLTGVGWLAGGWGDGTAVGGGGATACRGSDDGAPAAASAGVGTVGVTNVCAGAP